jgi:two-component system, chemotaxis family, CheB/CheR fusion protein
MAGKEPSDKASSPDIMIPEESLKTPEEERGKKTTDSLFPVVGIGASAGGLEALERFFANLASDTGMAFVIIVHLAPGQKSLMGELIGKYTKMNVLQIKDNMVIRPDTVYITPPNSDVATLHGKLYLMEPIEPHTLRLPIDYFFRSLAEDRREKAICIILSGTGSDGTIGLKAVKGEGGMVMVQAPESAQYDGMPRNAITTGLADYVLPVESLPEQLLKYVKHFRIMKKTEILAPKAINYLEKIYILLRNQTSHDFSHYKKTTIIRRVGRRMAVHQMSKLPEYVQYLHQNKKEVEKLFKELLIGVTSFFRDPEAFEALKREALPLIMAKKPSGGTVRVWVPGCSTGEEAYSLAMLFQEHMEENDKEYQVQLFATDIDTDAINAARIGVYPDGIAADVSPERLKKFFSRENNSYKVRKNIREMIIFAPQNVIKDPPFSRLDMVSCRNLLIYLDAEIQKKILSLFYYMLNEEGILFLGSSESIGHLSNMFSPVERKWKIFGRKGITPQARILPDIFSGNSVVALSGSRSIEKEIKNETVSFKEIIEKQLLDNYNPYCVLINDQYDVLYFYGKTGKYLVPANGEARLNISLMAREDLKIPLMTSIRQAMNKGKEVITKGIQIRNNGESNVINLIVRPLNEPESYKGIILIIFEEITSLKEKEASKEVSETKGEKYQKIRELENDLKAANEYLQTTIEELETSTEELKSTNEELQSSNEEYQSTNEELETSREELQSVNEELITVNSELQNKVDELTQATNDMNNLLASTEIATIFLDTTFHIKRFTPSTGKLINLIQSDIGRPVRDIVSHLKYDNLTEDAEKVLETLVVKESEVESRNGEWFFLRIMPYRTLENVINGVVITMINITQLKKLEYELTDARRFSESIIATIREPLIVLDINMQVIMANRSFYVFFKAKPQETENHSLLELGNGRWNIPELRKMLDNIINTDMPFENFQIEYNFPEIGRRVLLLNARSVYGQPKEARKILLAFEDIT